MRVTLFLIFYLTFLIANSQSIYIPYNIQEAYTNNTRSYTGLPGAHYFQNRAKYAITAAFDPKTGVLNGSERITYYNNSPDSLNNFVIRLYHDIMKKGNLRDEEIATQYLTNGVELKSFKINNEEYIGNSNKHFERKGTNLNVEINYYIFPGDSVKFDIVWKTILPQGHEHRFGKYGDGNWFVGYWYPQVAVFDDIDGWDTHNYTGLYEFYNDINDFEVEISLPADYLSWATGNWLNAQEILAKEVYNRYELAKISGEAISIITPDDWNNKLVFANKNKKVYRYSTNMVPDFAFAVSNNYNWNATSTLVDSVLNKRTVVHAVFPSSAKEFKDLAVIGAKSVNDFSFSSMKLPYPYANATLFCGGGGMEYPMMVNMQNRTASENNFTAMHELFHGYFPFYTGINECKYGWLDEGLTSYLPIETETVLNKIMDYPLRKFIEIYNLSSGKDQEPSLFYPTSQTRGRYFYHQSYYRSSAAFAMLEQYLGRDNFRSAIVSFIDNWKYKHPTGYDFIFSLNYSVEEDLTWLIKPWFFGSGWADLAIDTVVSSNSEYDIAIKNIGGMPVPVHLKIITEEGEAYFIERKADVWKDQRLIYVNIKREKKLKRIELGNINVPDKLSENNYYYFSDSNIE